MPDRARWLPRVALLLALALGVLPFAPLLDGDTIPSNTDYTRISLPELHEVREALLDGAMLEWASAIRSGVPYAPVPNAAGLYVPLLVALVAFGTVLGTAIANIAHLLFGALGAVALARRAGAAPAFAAFAALAYLWSSSSRLLGWSLPLEAIGSAWAPWCFWCALRAMDARRPLRVAAWGAAAGVAHAAIAWSGAYILLLWVLPTAALVLASCVAFQRPFRAALGRAVIAGGALVVTSLGMLAGRVLPIRAWTAITDRKDSISLENALVGRFDGPGLVDAIGGEGWLLFALAAVGLVFALKERRGAALAVGLSTVLVVVCATGFGTPFLHAYVPGFDQLRQPYRVWMLLPPLLAATAALGLCRVAATLSARRVPAVLTGVVLAAVAAAESLHLDSGVVDEGASAPQPTSLAARLERNAVLNEVARLRAEEGPYRVHEYEATRVLLKNTQAPLVAFLGLESMEGILGNIVMLDYDDAYLQQSRESPARMWGFMACRWVTSREPRDEAGLVLLGRYDDDEDEIYPGSDGPYLYRNDLCLPRAFTTRHAALAADVRPRAFAKLCMKPFWLPEHTVLIDAGDDPPPSLLAHFDRAFALDQTGASPKVREAGLPITTPRLLYTSRSDLPEPIRPLAPPTHTWNGLHLDLPPDAGESWLVLAETCALYPGWTAHVDGTEVPLHRANAAATALRLPAGARRVDLHYRTPRLRLGLAITAATALAVGALIVLATRSTQAA